MSQFLSSVGGLGQKRVLLLGALAVIFVAMLSTSILLLNKPSRETLYSGLDADDVNRIGSVLSEVGIAFDVNEAGNAVLVDYGKSSQARMILAQKGLPKSDKSGYELFDQMGSLGLTSFMQQVTRVRALEGELVRTIQQLEGIKAARVHLALKSDGAFRNREEQPSASVVIRADGAPSQATAASIRQIVAAAIPGLKAEQVTVMTTDGRLLSTAGETEGEEPNRMIELEARISTEAQERIERTLGPVTGLTNLRVSVASQLDLDKRQTTETNYDPESKVERSTRLVKSSDQTSDSTSARPVSADQNVPREVTAPAPDDSSSKKRESKEELINYEVDSRQTATVSQGFRVQKMSVAVVINRKIFLPADGSAPDEAKIKERVAQIEQLVKSASGFDANRNDTVTVSLIDFVTDETVMEPAAGPSIMETLQGNLGTIINVIGLIVALVVVIMLGLRPAMKMLLEAPAASPGMGDMGGMGTALPDLGGSMALPMAMGDFGAGDSTQQPESVDKLNKMVGIDVDRAAQVLKQWLDKPAKEAA
ncbi:MAG: flagellar M-ring protein FliF [Proteobacteria bacterium]|nr:flagellar M-ring protein FliF [Pseudomonadota bacterium]